MTDTIQEKNYSAAGLHTCYTYLKDKTFRSHLYMEWMSPERYLLWIMIFFIVKDPSYSLDSIMSISCSHRVEYTYYKSF